MTIETVHEQTHPLTELADGTEENEETWNDVEDPQDNFISTLWQDKYCVARGTSELS